MRAIPEARANIAAIADAIITAKRRADANVATTANVMANNARAGANVTLKANANKTASNTRKCVPTYQQPQMPT